MRCSVVNIGVLVTLILDWMMKTYKSGGAETICSSKMLWEAYGKVSTQVSLLIDW